MSAILDKVKKLLTLANNSAASEGERENALRMANGLLLKHNLDMADYNLHIQLESREDYVGATYGMNWCCRISNSIAKLFMCKYYVGKKINGTKTEHHFVGKTSNACTAQLMSEYVITSILAECRKRWKHNLAPESRSFSIGAADAIALRVKEMIKEAKPEGATSTSLTIVELYKTESEANNAFLKSSGVLLTKSASRQGSVEGGAYGEGRKHGQSIGLNSQVANRNQLRLGSK